jgi:hypothetical protein
MIRLELDKGFYPGGRYWRKHNPKDLTGSKGHDKFKAWIVLQGGTVDEGAPDEDPPSPPCVMFENEEDATLFKLRYM